MNGLQLISTGSALPRRSVSNAELAQMVDTDDAWITSRTGIQQRYFCSEGESAVSLAIAAASEALRNAQLTPQEVDCCICATVSGDFATPSVACMVQAALGLREDIPVLDVNAACTGFLYAASVARGLLCGNGGRYALVIGCEQLSRILDMTDRTTCILFGDGAGAGVLESTPESLYADLLGARGSQAICAAGPGSQPSHIQMEGRAVFRFAVEAIPRCIEGILAKTGLTLDDIDWVVCHQANERIIDHCIKKLSAPAEKFYKNMSRYGNTSAASIPLALDGLRQSGQLRPGMRLLCVGFGGGLTWAGTLLTWKGDSHETA